MTSEQAKDLRQTEMWAEICREMDALISFEEKKFRQCKPEEVKAIQDRIFVYERLKGLPEMVIDRESD